MQRPKSGCYDENDGIIEKAPTVSTKNNKIIMELLWQCHEMNQ
ncbi:hypothetical protein [Calothrix sp. PCC 6303]|nr:hypothetical protein [Calothrix sp. PCC 6303]AFZ00436.1 hypothetical protein Cal6303_1383 [Calothrix sp. PCC 6303]